MSEESIWIQYTVSREQFESWYRAISKRKNDLQKCEEK